MVFERVSEKGISEERTQGRIKGSTRRGSERT